MTSCLKILELNRILYKTLIDWVPRGGIRGSTASTIGGGGGRYLRTGTLLDKVAGLGVGWVRWYIRLREYLWMFQAL